MPLKPAKHARSPCALACAAVALIALTGAAPSRAGLRIDFDPMRPPAVAAAAAPASSASDAAPTATPGLPTLRITRLVAAGPTGPSAFSALVDDTWVRRGDVVAGYRVTALGSESVELVSLSEPAQRLMLHLNPVTVERSGRPTARPARPDPAPEKKP